MKTKVSIILLIILITCLAFFSQKSINTTIKIGIITPLSGSSAYWGESTMVGVKMAEAKLKQENVGVTFIPQDGRMDSTTALNAAQKLVNIDGVQAIYSEFNPASIPVASFLKGKQVFHLYDSAATSPLDVGPYNFKTYLDYKNSCRDVAKYLKDIKGVKKIGVLEMNLEHGILCVKGIREVYGNDVFVESYDPNATDFRVQLTTLNQLGVDAIFNASFQPQTLTSLREMHELKINKMFIGLSETMTPDVIPEFSSVIDNDIFFGLPPVGEGLRTQIKAANSNKEVSDYNAAGLAYIHLVQLGESLSKCHSDIMCTSLEMGKMKAVPEIGFDGFDNRIAQFNTSIQEFKEGQMIQVR